MKLLQTIPLDCVSSRATDNDGGSMILTKCPEIGIKGGNFQTFFVDKNKPQQSSHPINRKRLSILQ